MKVPGTRKEWETGGSSVWDLGGRPSVSTSVPRCTGGPRQLGNARKKNEKEIKRGFQVIKSSSEKILKESHKCKMNVLNATELYTLLKEVTCTV